MKSHFQQLQELQKKRIQRIVCSGGGAKGIVYPGAYRAMVETGMLKDIKTFSGTSAGAITATFMALGILPATFRDKSLHTNFEDLLGTTIGSIWGANNPGVTYITRDGKPLEQFIREHIIATLKESLNSLKSAQQITKNHPQFISLLAKINSPNPRITFGDLAILNQLFPQHFKQLNISAVTFPNGELQIFNSDLTPDVEIALACRASASIPLILEPVEIEINGIKKRFVDGGLYDNLPTDYFDKDDNGLFVTNKKPEQTMVFAFGEHFNNEDNQVFTALYGQQWDEVITDEILKTLISEAINLANKLIDTEDELNSADAEADLTFQTINLILDQHVQNKTLTRKESKIIRTAMNKAIASFPLQKFRLYHSQVQDKEDHVKLLAGLVKEQMKPTLYNPGFLEKFKRDVLIELFGDLHTPYKNTEQKEKSYHKLRSEYALRTVELRVGAIKTTAFSEAIKLANVMDALGYLDTMSYITNHELQDPELFDVSTFFGDLITNFEHIHRAVLAGSGSEPDKSIIIHGIASLKSQLKNKGMTQEIINREVYHFIKDEVEKKLDSVEAFALSRAVAFRNKLLTADDLFKETYEEGFKRSSFFSISNISGEQIFRTSTLHDSLKNKSMFQLYKNQTPHDQNTRTDKVFHALNKIQDFNQNKYSECSALLP